MQILKFAKKIIREGITRGPKLEGNSARNGFAADQQNQQEITKILVVEKKLSQRPKQEFLSQFDQKKRKKNSQRVP